MPALGALAGLDLVVVALVALILAFAAVALWRPFILGALGQLPVIGGWAQANVDALILRVAAGAVSWAQASVAPAGWAIDRLWADRHYLGGATLNALQATYNVIAAQQRALVWVIHAYVPAQVRAALLDAMNYANYVAGIVDAHVRQVRVEALNYANYVAGIVDAHVRQALAEAVAHTDAVAHQLEAIDRQALAEAVAHTDAVAHQLETVDVQLYGRAVAFAQAEARAVATEVIAEGERWREAVRQLDAEAHRLADGTLARADDYARALAVPIAAAVAALEDSPCQRFCSPLGDLGQLLQGLEDAGLAGLLVALAADSLHDPEGTRRTLTDLLGAPAQDAAQLLAQEVGMSGGA